VTGYTMWGFVHVLYLVGWANRIGAVLNWARAPWFPVITSQLASNAITLIMPGGAPVGAAVQFRMLATGKPR
jgi:hypothetical protein